MEEEKQFYSIILRHDTSTNWMAHDPILALGEYGVEDDTHKVKRGDGESKWSDLFYEDFGLTYIVTFKNLNGEIKDNKALLEAFESKVAIDTFSDVDNTVVAGMNITNDVEGVIGQITKITKNIATGTTMKNVLKVVSNDNTVQGYWSIDDYGVEVLNLVAESSISDYEEGHKYFKDQLCFHNKKLYRAHENFVAERKFNVNQWVLVSSQHSDDIRYDNLVSGLDADTVKGALDELKRRDDRKVVKSSEERIVYGTDALGQQTVIPVDDLRKVDTVNKIPADINKNVQLDANNINYKDAQPELGTVKDVLDAKVDKTVAGKGAKIVRDYQISYNAEDGNFTIVKDKVSLEDGSNEKTTETFSVASDKELADVKTELQDNIDQNKVEINERVDNEVSTLNARIDREVETLNTTIDNKDKAIHTRVTNEVAELNATIDANKTEINNRVDNEVLTLNNTIENNKTEINNRVDNEVSTLNTTIANNKTEIETRVTNEVAALNTTIATNKSDIEQKLADAKSELNIKIDANQEEINDRVDDEVRLLNETIVSKETALNNKINNSVTALDNKIASENNKQDAIIEQNKVDVNNRITSEVSTLNKTISTGLDTKIDRDIADNIITDIVASEETLEPTLKITRKNTVSEKEVVHHMHFTPKGNIKTKFVDGDHIQIDSTEIDARVQANADQLVRDDARMTAQDVEINALKQHDIVHERDIAANASLIANHENRVVSLEERADGFDVSIANLDSKIENETTNRKVADAKLETDISRNALNIENNTQAIRDNADNIIELNNLLQENVTNLTQSKLDKDFAVDAGDRVTANILLQELTGNEIAKAQLLGVVPTTKQVLSKTFTLASSDNTLVATPLKDNSGTVIGYDLATNLDIDVHYFITSETLNTVIASENVIAIDTLTSTTKNPVEVNDIVSDAEGTWARIQSIDEEAQTITCVTFHKHAQAVWGTVKGDIKDQADLQEELAKKLTIEGPLMASVVAMANVPSTNSDTGSYMAFIHHNTMTKETSTQVFQVNNTDGSIKLNGTSLIGDGTNGADVGIKQYALDLEVIAEKVKFDAKSSGLTSELLGPALRELKTLDDAKVLTTTFDSTISGINSELLEMNTNLTTLVNTTKTELQSNISSLNTQLNTLNTTLNGEIAKKLDKISTPNVIYGTDENGNQISIDKTAVGKVDTVNGVQADSNKNVLLTTNDIRTANSVAQYHENTVLEDILSDLCNYIIEIKEDLQSHISEYVPGKYYSAQGRYVTNKYVVLHKEDGTILLGIVMVDFVSSNITGGTAYDNFIADVTAGNIKILSTENASGDVEVIAEQSYSLLQQLDGDTEPYEGMGGTEEEIVDIMDEVLGTENE